MEATHDWLNFIMPIPACWQTWSRANYLIYNPSFNLEIFVLRQLQQPNRPDG